MDDKETTILLDTKYSSFISPLFYSFSFSFFGLPRVADIYRIRAYS
jgi:hypothetical protein